MAEAQHDETLAEQLLDRIFRPRITACDQRLRAAQVGGQLSEGTDLDLAIDLRYGGFYHRFLLRVAPLEVEYADLAVDSALSALTPRNSADYDPPSVRPTSGRTRRRS